MNVIDTDARFVIDPVSGEITNQSLKETITRGSLNSEVFTFEIPRNIGHDPCECNLIEIHYLNINARNKTETSEGIYKVNDIHGEDDATATFTWTIDGSASVFAGTLSFSIHFKCIDSEGKCLYRLPIKTYSKITVTDAIDNSGVVMEDNKDIIAEWEARISALEQNGGGGGGGTDSLTVTYEGDQASHTSDQIRSHVESGGCVYLLVEGVLYICLDDVDYNWAVFTDSKGINYSIDMEGRISTYQSTDMGDISAALDAIIAMQKELIGT